MNTTNGNQRRAKQMTGTILAAICAILLVDTAQAEDKVYSQQRVVNFADLNLNNSDGVEALYQRIQDAAKRVCGWNGPVVPEWFRLSKSCTDQAMAQAITAIGNPAVTSRYLATTRRTDKRLMVQAQ